jgi:serine/threonine-protein kinase
MPPEEVIDRPQKAETALLREWIAKGAPAEAGPRPRPFQTTGDVLAAIDRHLRGLPEEDRPFQRYFGLTHLHNLAKVTDDELLLYRAALSKLVNSLSWKTRIAVPAPVDAARTVFAVDLRDLDWDRKGLWQEILKVYPYGLRHDSLPDDETNQRLFREIKAATAADVPLVRADWLIATASRPPLYHTMLALPKTAEELEKQLGVDALENFRRDRIARAGFTESGVSKQNRAIERHESSYGAYWKSWDFKSDKGRGNLHKFPLGPPFKGHPFPDQAFEPAGGEVIFHLPNGLQGYLLMDGQGNRIDEGPIDVVRDKLETSGTPAIVNGLSCMTCHVHGLIRDFKDSVREGTAVEGDARNKVRRLYPKPQDMEKLLDQDDEKFLPALEKAIGPILRKEGDSKPDVRRFAEPIGPIARWYKSQNLGIQEVAAELGLKDVETLKAAMKVNGRLRRSLGPLPLGGTISRESWEEAGASGTSLFQETARELELGTPVRFHAAQDKANVIKKVDLSDRELRIGSKAKLVSTSGAEKISIRVGLPTSTRIRFIDVGTIVTVTKTNKVGDQVQFEIQDEEGNRGWVDEDHLEPVTAKK